MRKNILQKIGIGLFAVLSLSIGGGFLSSSLSTKVWADTVNPTIVFNETELLSAVNDPTIQDIEIANTYVIGGRGSGIQLTGNFDGKGKTIKVASNNYGLLVDDSYADNSYNGISPASITISNVNLVSEGGTNALPVLNVISVDDLVLNNSSFDMGASNNLQATMNLKAVSNVSLSGITAAGPGAFIDYAPKSENTMSLSFNDMNISTGSALVMDGATTAKLNFETNPLGTFFTDLPSYDSNGPIDLADKVATGEIDAPLVVDVTYSTTDETSQPVKVTLTANKQVSIKERLAGWVTTDAGMIFTKEFTTNELETITLVDSNGNSKVLTASVNWIVKPTPPSPTPTPEPTPVSSNPKPVPATPASTIEPKSEGELPKTGSSSGVGLSVIGLSFLVALFGFEIHRKFLKN